jgi:hypothetical protein
LRPLEEHIVQHTAQRIIQHIEQCSGRTRTLSDVIATERADRQKEVKEAVEEAQRAFETKLTALEERLKAVPGKVPVAKTWHPQSVIYQAEFVSHEGALYEARRDTAQGPGGADWVWSRAPAAMGLRQMFVARTTCARLMRLSILSSAMALRSLPSTMIQAFTPAMVGNYLSRQGKPGRRGGTGERGPRSDKGPPALVPRFVSSEIDGNYNLIILRSDGAREIIPLRAAFERYHTETSKQHVRILTWPN